MLPFTDQSILDLAWGLSFYFSENEQEKKYGEDLKKKWDGELADDDLQTRNRLQNVNAAMSATIYDLAQIRHQASDYFAFLDSVQKQKLEDLDDLASLSKDAESIATRLAGVSIGGGVTLLATLSSGLYFPYIVIGAGVSYFIFDVILKVIKWWRGPRILEEIQGKKDTFLASQIKPKYRQQLDGLLEKVHEIAPVSLVLEEAASIEVNRPISVKVEPGFLERVMQGKALGKEKRILNDIANTSANIHANAFVTGLTRMPSIMLIPSLVHVGDAVSVVGLGFALEDTSSSLSGDAVMTPASDMQHGTIEGRFVVSNVPAGSYVITATGSPKADRASAILTVTKVDSLPVE
jgi:hypothetical protein